MKTLVQKWDEAGRSLLPKRLRAAAKLVMGVFEDTARMRREAAKRYPGFGEL